MPELWVPSGGVTRKIKELYIPSGGVTRKIKEAYAPSGGANRKIFSSGVGYNVTTSDSTSSDWAASAFTLNGNMSGRMYAYVASGSYFSNATFSMAFAFDVPILKSNLPSGYLFRFDCSFNKANLSSNIVAGIHINNSNNSTGNYQNIVTKVGPNAGTNRLSWNITDIASSVASISKLELRVQADLLSSKNDTGYMEVTWDVADIWLINNWLNDRYGSIYL